MVWKKLNECVEYLEKPVLGTIDLKGGMRYMALSLDFSSKNPYKGVARQVFERIGSQDVPGYVDKSKLVLVESDDLLKWEIVGDLNIKGFEKIIKKFENEEIYFIGLEDPDILVDKKGKKHLYFTIPFKHKNVDWYDVYTGHAFGDSLENLKMTLPVLGKLNKEIVGFKEICPVPEMKKDEKFFLVETWLKKPNKKGYYGVGISKTKNLSKKWEYLKLIHDPEKESKSWCAGFSSPCRFFSPDILKHDKYLVGIINGREKTKNINGKFHYGKFKPGLFLFDYSKKKIVWIDKEPLFEDPLATTITFASELIVLNKKQVILYAHVNDNFVRAYRLNLDKIEERLPDKL